MHTDRPHKGVYVKARMQVFVSEVSWYQGDKKPDGECSKNTGDWLWLSCYLGLRQVSLVFTWVKQQAPCGLLQSSVMKYVKYVA